MKKGTPSFLFDKYDRISIIYSIIGCIGGSLLFSLISELWLISDPRFSFDPADILVFTFLSFVLTIFPSMICSIIIGRNILRHLKSSSYSVSHPIIQGILAGLIISAFTILLIKFQLVKRISSLPLMRYSVTGMFVAVLSGSITSSILARKVAKMVNDFEP